MMQLCALLGRAGTGTGIAAETIVGAGMTELTTDGALVGRSSARVALATLPVTVAPIASAHESHPCHRAPCTEIGRELTNLEELRRSRVRLRSRESWR